MVEATSNNKTDKNQLENRPRFERLRQIEMEIQEMVENGRLNEANPPTEYSAIDWDTKNASKYMCTFPYPYMNGYLHLGKCNKFPTCWFRLSIGTF
jgi:leucyl-tRNA synthetase